MLSDLLQQSVTGGIRTDLRTWQPVFANMVPKPRGLSTYMAAKRKSFISTTHRQTLSRINRAMRMEGKLKWLVIVTINTRISLNLRWYNLYGACNHRQNRQLTMMNERITSHEFPMMKMIKQNKHCFLTGAAYSTDRESQSFTVCLLCVSDAILQFFKIFLSNFNVCQDKSRKTLL